MVPRTCLKFKKASFQLSSSQAWSNEPLHVYTAENSDTVKHVSAERERVLSLRWLQTVFQADGLAILPKYVDAIFKYPHPICIHYKLSSIFIHVLSIQTLLTAIRICENCGYLQNIYPRIHILASLQYGLHIMTECLHCHKCEHMLDALYLFKERLAHFCETCCYVDEHRSTINSHIHSPHETQTWLGRASTATAGCR